MSTTSRARKHLFDILAAARAIGSFTSGVDEDAYLKNQLIQAAVERKFEIIGEALNRLSRDDAEALAKISDHQRIIGFRNILAHGYDAIDQRLVWDVVENHLMRLQHEVIELLEDLPPTS